jgi:hypothetical protein
VTLSNRHDPERTAIREALALGKAVYDRRTAMGISVAEVAMRAGMEVVPGFVELESGGPPPGACRVVGHG